MARERRRREDEDALSRRVPKVTRQADGRERHDILVTYGGTEFLLVVRKHPGTGEITLQPARAKAGK